MIANMGADVPADMRAQGVQFARPSTVLPVTSIATEQGTIPALAAPSPTIPGSFLLEQLRQLEPGAAVKPPLLDTKWPAMGAATPGESLMKTSVVDPATGLIREGDILSDVGAGTTEQLAPEGTLGRAAVRAACGGERWERRTGDRDTGSRNVYRWCVWGTSGRCGAVVCCKPTE